MWVVLVHVYAKAPAAPAAHPLNDVGLDAGLEIRCGAPGSEGMRLYLLGGQAGVDNSFLEAGDEAGSGCRRGAVGVVGGSGGEVKQG